MGVALIICRVWTSTDVFHGLNMLPLGTRPTLDPDSKSVIGMAVRSSIAVLQSIIFNLERASQRKADGI